MWPVWYRHGLCQVQVQEVTPDLVWILPGQLVQQHVHSSPLEEGAWLLFLFLFLLLTLLLFLLLLFFVLLLAKVPPITSTRVISEENK